MDHSPASQPGDGQQPYRGRVRTGCLICRRRKVKCDEAKPHCAKCKRLGRVCIYKQPVSTPPPPTEQRRDDSSARAKTAQLDRALSSHRQESPNAWHSIHVQHDPSDATDSPSALISRDIQLTTTMDYMAAQGAAISPGETRPAAAKPPRPPISDFFLQSVDCPGITAFDPVNWAAFKRRVVRQAETSSLACEALSAVGAIYRSQLLGVVIPNAVDIYTSTKQILHEQLVDMAVEDDRTEAGVLMWEEVLSASFLLCMAELLYNGDAADLPGGPLLKDRDGVMGSRLQQWLDSNKNSNSREGQVATAVTARVVAWLRIIHRITLRGGGTGLISEEINKHLCRVQDEEEEDEDNVAEQIDHAVPHTHRHTPLPNIRDHDDCSQPPAVQDTLFQALSWPLFEFYYRLQLLAGYIARLTHYRRSRLTAHDQDIVSSRIKQIRRLLCHLWQSNQVGLPGAMSTSGLDAKALQSQVAPEVAARVAAVMLLCEAAWHAEIVELDRVLGDPVDRYSRESRDSVQSILNLVDRSILVAEDARHEEASSPSLTLKRVNAEFLRPLFMCAIETIDDLASRERAINHMAQISDPIHKSDFFTAFARALAEEQQRKERRVTSKYFCLWYFGVAPPFM